MCTCHTHVYMYMYISNELIHVVERERGTLIEGLYLITSISSLADPPISLCVNNNNNNNNNNNSH